MTNAQWHRKALLVIMEQNANQQQLTIQAMNNMTKEQKKALSVKVALNDDITLLLEAHEELNNDT